MTEKFYKIRYKPFNLFYIPNRQVWHKNNLSKKGKVYATKPTLKYVDCNSGWIRGYKVFIWYKGEQLEVHKHEFEIVEYQVIERVVND